jgi:2-hydroxy-3-keto-5-methylthiopentenyl-1-phosphate phosphatase
MGERPPGPGQGRWAVLCDFDGTAVTEDIGDKVSIHFAGHRAWREAEDRYKAGEIPFSGLLAGIFAPITATREEIAEWARARAVLRPGIERLVAGCRDAGIPFVIVSAGLDVYIEAVLERLPPDLRAHVELRSNHAVCSPTGLTVRFHQIRGGCDRCGFCKGAVVEEFQGRGFRVAICGDGTADRCAAERADLVFARGRLPRYCEELGVRYTRFETFHEVAALLGLH